MSKLIATACAAIGFLWAGSAFAHDDCHDRTGLKVRMVVGIHGLVVIRDRDNNPPGPVGGPGTNWENPPGPKGGPGTSPNLVRRDRDDNPPGIVGGPGTNWENPPGPRGGRGASPNRRR